MIFNIFTFYWTLCYLRGLKKKVFIEFIAILHLFYALTFLAVRHVGS